MRVSKVFRSAARLGGKSSQSYGDCDMGLDNCAATEQYSIADHMLLQCGAA